MSKQVFIKDFMSSIVVFLVALPLCLGIAIASGVPPLLGIISGIIGGLVIAPFAGVSLQVSGPAAGLAVMVFQFVEKFGLESLVCLGLVAGVIQILAGVLKVGDFFRATSPALIKGMLGGIGVLILVSQVLVGLEADPTSSGVKNIMLIPTAIIEAMTEKPHAFLLLLFASVFIYLWGYMPKKVSSKAPGSLVGVIAATFIAAFVFTEVKFIEIPKSIIEGMNFVSFAKLELFSFDLLIMALGITFVASAETLLSAVAADKMAKKVGSDYNKELRAQGYGNFVAGLLGALPMTGVIVRSSANIEAGGQTRWASVMHGLWLLLFVFGFPMVLNYIPIAGLAAILVITGIKLLDLKSMPALWRKDKSEFIVYIVTIAAVVGFDLLTGVVLGFLASMVVLAVNVSKLHIKTEEESESIRMILTGTASFVAIPKISKALAEIKQAECCIDLSKLIFIDAAVNEQVVTWCDIARSTGKNVILIQKKSNPN